MIKFKILAVLMMGIGILGAAHTAKAAQSAEVIVPSANVYMYPQASSKVISKLGQGEVIAVSNIPTEGFYKVRLKSGDMGWISGNDVLSGSAGQQTVGVGAAPRARARGSQRRTHVREEEPDSSGEDSFRLLVGYGAQFPAYGGIKDNFGKNAALTSGLTPGKHFGIEAQFSLSRSVYWGLRLEVLNASTVSNIDDGTTQSITIKELPVEVGIMWSPISTHKFRFGLGGYLGAVPSASTKITQTVTATSQEKNLEYATIQMCAEASVQFSFGLGERIGIFVEGDYRYDQTGKNPDTTVLGAVPGFKIDYSGVMARGGLELRL